MKGRLLIVEDEPAIVRGLTDIFRQHGFEVSGARPTARPGSQPPSRQTPDLILLDIMLPQA